MDSNEVANVLFRNWTWRPGRLCNVTGLYHFGAVPCVWVRVRSATDVRVPLNGVTTNVKSYETGEVKVIGKLVFSQLLTAEPAAHTDYVHVSQ